MLPSAPVWVVAQAEGNLQACPQYTRASVLTGPNALGVLALLPAELGARQHWATHLLHGDPIS